MEEEEDLEGQEEAEGEVKGAMRGGGCNKKPK